MNSSEDHGGSPSEIEAAPTTSQYTRRRFVKRTGKTAIGAVLALAAFSAEQDAFAGGSSSFLYFVGVSYPGGYDVSDINATYPDGHPKTIVHDGDIYDAKSYDTDGPDGTPLGLVIASYSVTPTPQTEIWAGQSPEEDSGRWIYGAEGSFSVTVEFNASSFYYTSATSTSMSTGPSVTKSITFSCTYDKSGFTPSVSGGGDPGDPPVEDGQFQVTFNRTNPKSAGGFGVEFMATWSGKDEEGFPFCEPITSAGWILEGSWSPVTFQIPS